MADGEEETKRGRPTLYKPEFVEQVEKLCRLGATDYEIADFFEVNVLTIHRWKHEHEDFCNALKAGKDVADERVVRAFYQRAVGYSFEAEKLFSFQGEVIRAQVTEHIPPDVGAILSWLKNRRPKEWRDVKQLEHSGAIGSYDLSKLSDEQLTQLATILAPAAADMAGNPGGDTAQAGG